MSLQLVIVRFYFRSISPLYVFDLYLIEHYIFSYEQYKFLYSYLSLIHEYMSILRHTLWEVFFI
jgi:hypothetical protein